ncbi:hypothetical protein BC567DRAFT_247170 [Phyllosticta citribraziliensis]
MDVKTPIAQKPKAEPQVASSPPQNLVSTIPTPEIAGKSATDGKLSTEELVAVLPNSWDLLKEKVECITRRYIDCCNASLDKIERSDFYYSFEIEDSLEQWESVALDLRRIMNKMIKLQLYEPDDGTYVALLQALTMILQWKTVRDSLANAMRSTSISEE